MITLYVTLTGLIIGRFGEKPEGNGWLWAAFVIGFVATPVYLSRIMKVKKRRQLAISIGAFTVWALAVGQGPFTTLSWYDPFIGAVLLPTYTFVIPIIEA